jgi:hypothetical protein
VSRVARVTAGSSGEQTLERLGVGALWLAPLALYALIFASFTFPLLARFSTHFFANDGDGLSNVWNLWWVEAALTRFGTSPWFTTHLHFPHGTTLLGHTLNPFNGFLAVLLEPWLGLVQTHNAIVVFSFVFGAWAAFRLALHVSGGYPGSLIAGFVFGFSNYHFAHAEGHLNLVSLEWIPLFLLAWLRLLERPSAARAIGAALALLLVLLCDHYYFLYCVIAAMLLLAVEMRRRRDVRFWLRAPTAGPFAVFLVASALSSGVLVALLLRSDQRDPLVGGHDAWRFSMDLLALWIPGAHWRFHAWSEAFWSRLPGNTVESSVHLGLGVTLAALLASRRRARAAAPQSTAWWVLLAFFALMSLGPSLQIWGRAQPIPLPYRLLELLLPTLRISGVPVRMVVMVTLAAGILAGVGLDALLRGGVRARLAALAVLACMTLEFLPRPLASTDAGRVPGWVAALAGRPGQHGFMDATEAFPEASALYLQTLHEVPIYAGFVARLPASVFLKDRELWKLRERRDFESLCARHGFAYFLLREGTAHGALPVAPVWRGEGLELYDVRAAWSCRAFAE